MVSALTIHLVHPHSVIPRPAISRHRALISPRHSRRSPPRHPADSVPRPSHWRRLWHRWERSKTKASRREQGTVRVSSKALFGGSSVTTPSSFTDLKTTSSKSFNENKRPISEISKDEDDEANHQNHDDDNDDEDEEEQPEEGNQASLLKTVAEYEAKRASTHPTTTHIQGDTSTGEESETTKFQVRLKPRASRWRCETNEYFR